MESVHLCADVANYTGIDRKKIGKDLGDYFTKLGGKGQRKYITKVALARLLS